MDLKKPRTIKWHCECGHDFEVETELKQDRCPRCGGTDVQRVEEKAKWARIFGDSDKHRGNRWWR